MADTYPAKYKSDTEQYQPGYGKEEANPIAPRPKATLFGRKLAGQSSETPNMNDRRAGGYTRQGAINRKAQLDEADQ